MNEARIRRRLVYHVGGFDRMPPEMFYRRFVRELRRFETTWSATAHVTEPVVTDDVASWQVTASGSNWRVETVLHLIRWDDVIAAAGERALPARLATGFVALCDFVLAGALWGYLRTNWRYALFSLYPIVLLATIVGVTFLAAWAVHAAFGMLPALAVGSAIFMLLVRWPGQRLFLLHLLDDWTFSRRYVRQGDPFLQARLARVARQILADGRHADEVLVVGHSLGAVLAIDCLDQALAVPAPAASGPPRIALLTVGSSVLKIGLHRAANRFRAAVKRVAESSSVFWVEYQAIADVMNFYKTNPVATLRLEVPGRPLVRIVRISRMLHPTFYRRIRGNFFRMHNQFISGNDLRAAYDYFQFLCGPLAADTIAHSPDGAVSALGPDGEIRPHTALIS